MHTHGWLTCILSRALSLNPEPPWQVLGHTYEFERRKLEAAFIRKIDRAQLQAFYKTHLSVKSATRRRFSSHVVGKYTPRPSTQPSCRRRCTRSRAVGLGRAHHQYHKHHIERLFPVTEMQRWACLWWCVWHGALNVTRCRAAVDAGSEAAVTPQSKGKVPPFHTPSLFSTHHPRGKRSLSASRYLRADVAAPQHSARALNPSANVVT